MTIWFALWLALIVAMVLIEAATLGDKREGDTLSEHVWKWLAVKDGRHIGLVAFRRTLILLFGGWLTAYFMDGGRI